MRGRYRGRVLNCLAVICLASGCAGIEAAPMDATPSPIVATSCDRLSGLAVVCGRTFYSQHIRGGSEAWTKLPPLELTMDVVADSHSQAGQPVTYLRIKTGVNTAMVRVRGTAQDVIPIGPPGITAVGHGPGAELEAARETWVLHMIGNPMQWSLTGDLRELVLTQGEDQVSFRPA